MSFISLPKIKRPGHWRIWLLLTLLALVAVACSPAGNDNAPAGQGGSVTKAAVQDDPAVQEAPQDEPAQTETAETAADEPAAVDEAEGTVDEAAAEETTTEEAEVGETAAEEAPDDEESTVDEAADTIEAEAPQAEPEVDEDGFFTADDRSERQRLISIDWNTDWFRHTVPYDELLALLPVRDGIPAIDNPIFISQEEAAEWIADNEPVIVYEAGGDARAYPIQIMTYHEIVNDTVGDVPVIVTFCPLCNSAIVFDRNLNGRVYDFGTSGWLRNSDLVMYDRQTDSLWQQFTGEGLVGELAGEQLTFLPSSMVSFADFRQAFPDGIVLSRETGHERPYGQNPYPGYDQIGQNPFAFLGKPDGRLAAMERVIAVTLDDVDVAYPLDVLFEMGVINDTQAGQDLVIFHVGGTSSALDTPVISQGADVGATGVFDPHLNGQNLTFSEDGQNIVDDQTGSIWNVFGQAIDGPLTGEQLTPLVHGDHFWFAWAAFQPDTIIFGS